MKLSSDVKNILDCLKLHPRQSYDEVIKMLIYSSGGEKILKEKDRKIAKKNLKIVYKLKKGDLVEVDIKKIK